MCASRGGCTKPARRSEGECRRGPAEVRPGGPGCRRITGRFYPLVGGVERERACRDPKDGELCLKRLKPEETLVEDRSDSDVQIDRQIWRPWGRNVLNLFSNFKLVRSPTRLIGAGRRMRVPSGPLLTAGRWPWKSESAKECVTTHLPNQSALKMDGAGASGLYPAVAAVRARTGALCGDE
ncbi:unnamed protein product [Clavelina lepadiformis]|uniref:Uncharacterized protein n=1 Tax=Clavelina lepadiformis TaxID=159417 RepID=A0ABP0F347_CLALP